MWPNPQFPADLATFTEEILNGKLHFLCSASVFFYKSKTENKKVVIWNIIVYSAIRYHQIKKVCLSWLKQETYQKAIAKRFRNRKMHMWNFLFRLPNMKISDKKKSFSVKSNQKGKYIKKYFWASERLIQFLNKATTLFYMIREQEIYIIEWSKIIQII